MRYHDTEGTALSLVFRALHLASRALHPVMVMLLTCACILSLVPHMTKLFPDTNAPLIVGVCLLVFDVAAFMLTMFRGCGPLGRDVGMIIGLSAQTLAGITGLAVALPIMPAHGAGRNFTLLLCVVCVLHVVSVALFLLDVWRYDDNVQRRHGETGATLRAGQEIPR